VADFTSQKLDGYQTTALPATVASSGRLVVNNGATFRMNGEIKNLGSVEMSEANAELGKLSNLSETAVMSFSDMRSLAAGAIENLGTFTLTGSSMTLSGQYEYWPHGYTSVGNTEIRDYDYTINNKGTLNIENSSVTINGSLEAESEAPLRMRIVAPVPGAPELDTTFTPGTLPTRAS